MLINVAVIARETEPDTATFLFVTEEHRIISVVAHSYQEALAEARKRLLAS